MEPMSMREKGKIILRFKLQQIQSVLKTGVLSGNILSTKPIVDEHTKLVIKIKHKPKVVVSLTLNNMLYLNCFAS